MPAISAFGGKVWAYTSGFYLKTTRNNQRNSRKMQCSHSKTTQTVSL